MCCGLRIDAVPQVVPLACKPPLLSHAQEAKKKQTGNLTVFTNEGREEQDS